MDAPAGTEEEEPVPSGDAITPINLVVVGDSGCGKTCFLITYATSSFPSGDYIPTVFDNYVITIVVDGTRVGLCLRDTAGQEYDRFRPLVYSSANVVLLLFSTLNMTSFENIKTKWIHEVNQFCPGVPKILVGTKIDVQDNVAVNFEQASQFAREISAVKYMECSSLTKQGLSEIFEEAVRAVLPRRPSKERSCLIM